MKQVILRWKITLAQNQARGWVTNQYIDNDKNDRDIPPITDVGDEDDEPMRMVKIEVKRFH